jgi:CHASE2 domain-containing sensor protein
MLVEGLLLLGYEKIKPDVLAAMIALLLYIVGLISWISTLAGHRPLLPLAFPLAVLLLIIWSGLQWLRLTR